MDGALLQLVQDGMIDAARGLRPGAAQGSLRAVPRRRGRGRRVTRPPRLRRRTNRIDRFLAILPKRSGSDLHLSVGSPADRPHRRRARAHALPRADRRRLLQPARPDHAAAALGSASTQTGDVDFAYQMGQMARFRVNLFRQERGSAAVFRLIPSRVPTAEELNLPPSVAGLYAVPRGLVLVTGPTGSGKSTTLAAMLDRINKRLAHHVDHDRGPDRVRAHQRQVRLHAARDRPRRRRASPRASRPRSARTPTACSSARCATSRRCAWR